MVHFEEGNRRKGVRGSERQHTQAFLDCYLLLLYLLPFLYSRNFPLFSLDLTNPNPNLNPFSSQNYKCIYCMHISKHEILILIYKMLFSILQFKQMNRFPYTLLITLFLVCAITSQNASIAYIEGCANYAQDGCCQLCEYGYTLTNAQCLRNNNETTDCCATYNSDGSCSQCSRGLFYSDPYCYRNQIYACVKKSGNTCLACGLGFTLQNGICFLNIANCQKYSPTGECISCGNGFALVNSYCIPFVKVDNCQQGNIYGCISCSLGYYLTTNRSCAPNAPGCLKYYREKCIACLSAFNLQNGRCSIDGCQVYGALACSQCQNGYELENGRCFANNCAKVVNGLCVACKRSYRLSANGCVQEASYSCKACQSGYLFLNNRCVKIIFGCLSYTSSGNCQSCRPNFQLTINGICQIQGCALYNDNGCINCNLPFQLLNNSCTITNCLTITASGCTNCAVGYFIKNGQCALADPNCQNYANSACTLCKDRYHFQNGLCVINQRGCVYSQSGICTCGGKYTQGSNGKCIILGCSSYDNLDNCIACSPPFTYNSTNGICFIGNCVNYTQTSCRVCSNGFLVFNGECQRGDAYCQSYGNNGVCACCKDGFFIDSQSGKCIKNIPNCIGYIDQLTCQSCKVGFTLINNACLANIPNCQTLSSSAYLCIKCNNGYYLVQGSCVLKDANCLNYIFQNSSQICSGCVSGYRLIQGKCLQNQPGCVYTGNTCSSCVSPFVFDPSSNSCFVFGCVSYNLGGCVNCKAPFTLQNNTCLINFCLKYNQDGCVNCANGFNLVNGICVSIDVNCITFTNNQCTACKQGYSLVNSRCVLRDPNCNTYGNDGNCLSCISSCYFDVNRRCQVKDLGCIYEGGRCKYCNPPFEFNPAAGTCVIKNCLQANAAGCLLCQPSFIISNGACTLPNCNVIQNNACVQCKGGYHIKKGVFCEINNPDCLSYDEDGNCQQCKAGLTLTSNAQCSKLSPTCVQVSKQDRTKCLSCSSGYFLNKFYQCQRQDGKCIEYTNGVCSKCSERYFLYSQICFPYTEGCVQYCGKDCTVCKNGFILKNGECFKYQKNDIGVLGDNDRYNFSITPIDVRQSKYYINNLSPGSQIGKFFFSSYLDANYQDCSLSTNTGVSGKGWKAGISDSSQFIGLLVNEQPVTFYALQLEQVQGSYIQQFYLQYSTNGVDFIRIQNSFLVDETISSNMTTIYFTGIYAKAIRIKIIKYKGSVACRIDFFYYDLIRYRKISNLKSLKYLQNTINSTFVDRVNNQIYINQAYFFNPIAACTIKEMCFTGLQLCQLKTITSLSLNFGAGGVVSEFYLTYSVDGRSYNCFNGCAKIPVNAVGNTFSYSLNNLNAVGVRIYPTKYSGNANFSPIFYYQ